MCGIVGYSGQRLVINVLLSGLKRLEYRGYDSAGVAFFVKDQFVIRKAQGKLENVIELMKEEQLLEANATCGIGHTRWATHGKPTTQNAHPHRTGHVVLVHNGIIENYQEIKADLIKRGHKPASETDSELFGFLVLEEMETGLGLEDAVRNAFKKLEGACSVVVMSEREPGKIVGVRNGSPLVAAIDPQGGAFLASDAQPLLSYTKEVIFLENGDVAIGTPHGLQLVNLSDGAAVTRDSTRLDWSPEKMDKQGFPHYMLKEIHEQPVALVDTLNGLLDRATNEPFKLAPQPAVELLDQAKKITIIACGTSWHAALMGKYWIEKLAHLPVEVELASEYRYRSPVLGQGDLVLGMTQSGETADTLAVIRDMKSKKIPTIGLTNVRGSTIAREADAVFFTSAGPEIGVAATKTYLAQMTALFLIAGYLACKRSKASADIAAVLFEEFLKMPHLLRDELASSEGIIQSVKRATEAVLDAKGFFFIGRGFSYPLALEGALKLKEIAYVHAEGYAAGELKHGPIAMIDTGMVVVVLAPQDSWRDKTISNLEEVKARGARIVGVGAPSDKAMQSLCDYWISLPAGLKEEVLLPFGVTPAIQLLSYELALAKGTDIDKPRNLAKSVTVE